MFPIYILAYNNHCYQILLTYLKQIYLMKNLAASPTNIT